MDKGTQTLDSVTLVWASERPKRVCPSFTRRNPTAQGEGAAFCRADGAAKVGFPLLSPWKQVLLHKQGLGAYKSPDTWVCVTHVFPGIVFTSYSPVLLQKLRY